MSLYFYSSELNIVHSNKDCCIGNVHKMHIWFSLEIRLLKMYQQRSKFFRNSSFFGMFCQQKKEWRNFICKETNMSNIQLDKLLKSDDVYSAKRYGRQS